MAYKKIGSVLKGKEGGSYIKIDEDVNLKKGTFINVSDPRTKPDTLLELGKISEEVYHKMKEKADKIPEFVLFELSIKSDE